MSNVAFADVVHQTIYFSRSIASENLVLKLLESSWVQRLRDISQTGNTSLVYMFMEHSRFGHSLGVAHLANHLMSKLREEKPREVEEFALPVSAAALLHDIGHIAPGSHSAYRTWFPEGADVHEQISIRVIKENPEIQSILNAAGPNVLERTVQILEESDKIPAWTWEIISGGGWNVDRGNWCIVDSVMAGVTYGRYNISALIEALTITGDGHLALRESRKDAMMHFAIARHSMYRQVYQHRVYLASEAINQAIVQRARDLGAELKFADEHACAVLKAKSPEKLSLSTIFAMRESWWWYHVNRWTDESDPILSDLAKRLRDRKLFKTVRINPGDDQSKLVREAEQAARHCGFDPKYYLREVTAADMHAGDSAHSLLVLTDDGKLQPLSRSEPLWNTMIEEGKNSRRSWLVMPDEVKRKLGKER